MGANGTIHGDPHTQLHQNYKSYRSIEMGANVPTGVSPNKSGSHGYQYILVVGAFSAFFFGTSTYPQQ